MANILINGGKKYNKRRERRLKGIENIERKRTRTKEQVKTKG
jgi:hypothetical protein